LLRKSEFALTIYSLFGGLVNFHEGVAENADMTKILAKGNFLSILQNGMDQLTEHMAY
jgi:hypothetical protein